MKFIADLHVHSKYSRATAKNLDLENLYYAAQIKGITVVGTGDFTHPAWFDEIREKLVPAEPGLFKLRDEIARHYDQQVPDRCRRDVRFVLATEISNIYKKDEKTRKNHNLVFVPNLEVAAKFNARLDKIGNIHSDGRPILGLDARDLLEIVLDTSDEAFLIPAHIWTPWFSVLGSKSGFDSIEACFEDLTPHIFAVETGLSSDPEMNWRISSLDGLTLVSNSDAHSPLNLGREANLFDTELSYFSIRSALKDGNPESFLGTLEFYPEEGKYHLDGHRKCNVRLMPKETIQYNGKCPVCGKALTLGVLYRVEELADRNEGQKPVKCNPYYSLVPLADILSEIFRVGPKSKKVGNALDSVINTLGAELEILHNLEVAEIDRAGIPLLSEAIQRMRRKELQIIPGYDGEYGRVQLFSVQEREHLIGQKSLFAVSSQKTSKMKLQSKVVPQQRLPLEAPDNSETANRQNVSETENRGILSHLNTEQRQAVEHSDGPVLIVAGPGTGKTRTLTHRIAYIIGQKRIPPSNILAVTFTNKAAEEMRERLKQLLGKRTTLPLVTTFHAFCLKVLNDLEEGQGLCLLDENDRKFQVSEAIRNVKQEGWDIPFKANFVLRKIIAAKQQILGPRESNRLFAENSEATVFKAVYQAYENLLALQGAVDYEDLIFKVVRLFETNTEILQTYKDGFKYVFVDEYQDLNQGQYRIIRALVPSEDSSQNLFVIGDPDQSIYGFRGSEVKYFQDFIHDYPETTTLKLTRNYRSTETILDASFQMIRDHRMDTTDGRTYSQIDGQKTISIFEQKNEKAEAESVARMIERLVGGTGFHSIDTGLVADANIEKARSYTDFAVLYRTHEQSRSIAAAFDKFGIPYQLASRESVINQSGIHEVVSFLKLIEGVGGYLDHEKIILHTLPGMGKKTLEHFKTWCYQNKFSLEKGLANARRFPIPGINKTRQQMINDFTDYLATLAKELSGKTVADKLFYIGKNTILSSIADKNPDAQEVYKNLIEFSRNFDTNTTEFLAMIALQSDTDAYEAKVEKVALMTLHTAKGLEFPVVFITGCENDYIPFRRSDEDSPDMAEERRLFYVAMTRAKERLILTHAGSRRVYGKVTPREISPFIADIETRLKTVETTIKKKKKKEGQKQLELF